MKKAVRKMGRLLGTLVVMAVLLGTLSPMVQAQGSSIQSKHTMNQKHVASQTTTASKKKKAHRKHTGKKKEQSNPTSSSTTSNKK
jgi:hypothetical protein